MGMEVLLPVGIPAEVYIRYSKHTVVMRREKDVDEDRSHLV